jgi:hypothetical protein
MTSRRRTLRGNAAALSPMGWNGTATTTLSALALRALEEFCGHEGPGWM